MAVAVPNVAELASFAKIVSDSANMRFNQDQELEADSMAIGLLDRAGYSATALLGLINRIPGDSSAKLSHPANEVRLKKLKEMGAGARYSVNQLTQARFTSQTLRDTSKVQQPKADN